MKFFLVLIFAFFTMLTGCLSQSTDWKYSENSCENDFYINLSEVFFKTVLSEDRRPFYFETDILIVEAEISNDKVDSYKIESVREKPDNILFYSIVFDEFFRTVPKICNDFEKQFFIIEHFNLEDKFQFSEKEIDSIIGLKKKEGFVWKKMPYMAGNPRP